MTYDPSQMTPFHAGERAIQDRLGVTERMETFGKKVVRNYMPDQHRNFFAKLPFLVVGAVDDAGWPWATFVYGQPGFIRSPDPRRLDIAAHPFDTDPAKPGLTVGAAVGLLGIELSTRRRNRMNGQVVDTGAAGFSVQVDQSFGNCSMYIQTRDLEFTRPPDAPFSPVVEPLKGLDDEARTTIARADTFFMASYLDEDGDPNRRGVDVSHRGGNPGFVHIADDDTLTIPDFSGNRHFNTLGNLLLNPRAGLSFPDFSTGDMIQLIGSTEIDFDPEHAAAFAGAERLWRFRPERGVRLKGALPIRGPLLEVSEKLSGTGPWQGEP